MVTSFIFDGVTVQSSNSKQIEHAQYQEGLSWSSLVLRAHEIDLGQKEPLLYKLFNLGYCVSCVLIGSLDLGYQPIYHATLYGN